MKKFVVIKVYKSSCYSNTVEFSSDNKADAFTWADLMMRNGKDAGESYTYAVYCTCEK